MENTITAHVLGARRGSIDGSKFASLFVMEKASDENSIGMVPMKLTCAYGLMDTLDPKSLPGEFEIKVNLKPAAGGKLGMEAVAIKPIKPALAKP